MAWRRTGGRRWRLWSSRCRRAARRLARGVRGSALGFFAAGAVLSALLTLGPVADVAGRSTGLPAPYAVLYHYVPGFDGLRVPARYAMLTMACLAVLGGIRRTSAARAAARPGGRRDGACRRFWSSSPPPCRSRSTTAATAAPYHDTAARMYTGRVGARGLPLRRDAAGDVGARRVPNRLDCLGPAVGLLSARASPPDRQRLQRRLPAKLLRQPGRVHAR